MDGSKRRPSNMGQLCRLCLTEDAITLPIFSEEDSSSQSQVPLSFRIMACVSVEVALGDGLPAVICEKCLDHVNTWHEFKQICDLSQATLKEWQNSSHEVRDAVTIGDKDIFIKQEPLDEEQEEDVMEIIDEEVDQSYMVDFIKQEVDSYEEGRQDCVSVETVNENSNDPLGVPVTSMPDPPVVRTFNDDEIEIIPIPQVGDVSHLRITDIKTESNNSDPVDEVTVTPSPSEGRLLRSVLQGKRSVSTYSKSYSNFDKPSRVVPSVKPYQCQACGKSFSYNYLLKRHEKIHAGDKNICGFCGKGFSSHGALVQHIQMWSENGSVSKPYTCDHCNEKFACRTHYLMHADGSDGSNCIANNVHIVTDDGNYKCEECFTDFPSVMLLRLHMRKEHLHFSCHKCNKIFSNGVSLSNHLRSHSSHAMRHYCEKCPVSFTTPEQLKKHERTHMKEASAMTVIPHEVVTNSSEYSIPTESCELPQEDEVASFEPVNIKQEPPDSPDGVHESRRPFKMVTSRPHRCQICNEDFPTLASLRFHLKGVHLHYQCHRCPKVYSSGVALSNHLRSHSAVITAGRKHKCLSCFKIFATLELLMKHKKTRCGPPNFIAVKDPLDLELKKNHDLTSLGNKAEENKMEKSLAKRTCSLCNTVFTSRSALDRHMTTHNKMKAYTCKICGASMTYASSLQKHYRVMHNENVEFKSIQRDPIQNDGFETPKSYDSKSAPSVSQISQNEVPPVIESFTRSGRRVLSFNKSFKTAQQIQRPRVPLPFECKVCKRTFAYRSFLLKHSKVHERQRAAASVALVASGAPGASVATGAAVAASAAVASSASVPPDTVSCQICNKTFADAKTLNNHKGVHTRFKHYGCNTCGKSFNGLNAWRKHERMHQKGYIYSCKLCGKKFISKAELHSHKKMHIKLKIYTCNVCKNSYSSSSALGKHKRRHGHYSTSAGETDMSDLELVAALKTPNSKSNKQSLIKSSGNKLLIPRPTTAIRNPISRPVPKSATHYQSGKKRPFCVPCNKLFSNMRSLRRHKLMHDRIEKPIIEVGTPANPLPTVPETNENTCLTCNRVFPDHTSLVRHKGWHTRKFNFPVSTPTPTTPVSEPLPINPCFVKLEPSPVIANQCTICNRTFSSNSALENHTKSHSETGKNNSHVAEKSGKVPVVEEKIPVLNPSRRLACKICKKPFDSKKALITHIGWHSRGAHSLKPLLSTVKSKVVTNPSAVVGESFSCNVCQKMFSSAVMLSKHKKLHTRKLMSSIKVKSVVRKESIAESEGSYTCPVCMKVFKFVKYLNLHMRLHTGEKRFKCNLCSQAYHRSGSLWKHKRTHHAFKVFCCHICQKRFGLKTQLTKHMETHGSISVAPSAGTKTFTVFACSLCEKTFAKVEKLRQHERTHRA